MAIRNAVNQCCAETLGDLPVGRHAENVLDRFQPFTWDFCVNSFSANQIVVVAHQEVYLAGAEVVVEWLQLLHCFIHLINDSLCSQLLLVVTHGVKVHCVTDKNSAICLPFVLNLANEVKCLRVDSWCVEVRYNQNS